MVHARVKVGPPISPQTATFWLSDFKARSTTLNHLTLCAIRGTTYTTPPLAHPITLQTNTKPLRVKSFIHHCHTKCIPSTCADATPTNSPTARANPGTSNPPISPCLLTTYGTSFSCSPAKAESENQASLPSSPLPYRYKDIRSVFWI